MYVRQIGDQVLTFRVSGKLWMRSLVMSDVETDTEWSHLLGRAMDGQLKGKVLKPIVADMVTWSSWRRDFPDTTAIDLSRTSNRYTRQFYRDAERYVFGFKVDGKPWMVSLASLLRTPVHTFQVGDHHLVAVLDKPGYAIRLFKAEVGGTVLKFLPLDDRMMRETTTGGRWSTSRGEALDGPMAGKQLEQRVGIMSFRKAWMNFHPDSSTVDF